MDNIKAGYRLIALMMAFLMFFASAGLTMDMHYCGGELKSVSFFGKAKTCHELDGGNETPMMNCPHHNKMMTAKKDCSVDKDCCSNKIVHLQSDLDQKIQPNDFVISKQLKQFVVAYLTVFFTPDFDLEGDADNFSNYKPPLIPRDIPVLNQTFLL